MTQIEKVKHIRNVTMSPVNKINKALIECNGDVDKSIELLIKQRDANAFDMVNRHANNNVVYSYVHNNKIGAMIVLSSQTDFVAKNELFIQLAKDICMHIVANPNVRYIDKCNIDKEFHDDLIKRAEIGTDNEPIQIREKIVNGKLNKDYETYCLLEQKFVKDDSITIKELISKVSSIVGEKIEIKKMERMSA